MPDQKLIKYALHDLLSALVKRFPTIHQLHLFGSRRYRTRSLRSDIDVLVECDDHVRPADLREFIAQECPALDLFILEKGKATSTVNESFASATDNAELIRRLEAVKLWSRQDGFASADVDWDVVVGFGVDFSVTVLPNRYLVPKSIEEYLRTVRDQGLPTEPYLGASVDEVSRFVLELFDRIIEQVANLGTNARKRDGWPLVLTNEYDLQDLFYLVSKPWLPDLERETTAIVYDGQEKVADFSMLEGQLLIEVKHIASADEKRAVVKTLSGLSEFYKRNANVRAVLFVLLVDKAVDLDKLKWEHDFTYVEHLPRVLTRVLRNK